MRYSLHPDLGGPTTTPPLSAASPPNCHLRFLPEPREFGRKGEKETLPERSGQSAHMTVRQALPGPWIPPELLIDREEESHLEAERESHTEGIQAR